MKQDRLSEKHWENWDGGGVEGCAEQGRGWFSSCPNRCCKTDPHNELPGTELLAGFPFCCRDEIPEESTLGEKRFIPSYNSESNLSLSGKSQR